MHGQGLCFLLQKSDVMNDTGEIVYQPKKVEFAECLIKLTLVFALLATVGMEFRRIQRVEQVVQVSEVLLNLAVTVASEGICNPFGSLSDEGEFQKHRWLHLALLSQM